MMVTITAFVQQGMQRSVFQTVSQSHSVESSRKHFVPDDVGGSSSLQLVDRGILGPTTTTITTSNDVLGPTDVAVGVFLAVGLAFLGAYLQGRRNNQDIVLWTNDDDNARSLATSSQNNATLFDGEAWEEMSREENYVYYNTRIRKQLAGDSRSRKSAKTENKWVVLGLLVLFVPIFSAEFFLALSRGIICELFGNSNLAQEWCAPYDIQ